MAGLADITIRHATVEDAPAIGRIYNHYIEHSIATFHLETLPEAYWIEWFDRFDNATPYQAFVAVLNNEVVGFIYASPYSDRGAYFQSTYTSIYLDHDYLAAHPSSGLGTRLYETMFEVLTEHKIHRVIAGISQPNPASMALHSKMGFREVARFSEIGYKFDTYIDVVYMEKALT